MTISAVSVLPGTRQGVRTADGGLTLPPGWGFGGGTYVYDAQSARRVPAVGRAIQLYGGLVKQCSLEAYRGYSLVDPTPRLLARPDPFRGGPEFVQLSVEDYLLSGNAIALVTARGADGWPLAVTWLPALWTFVQWMPPLFDPTYYYLGTQLPTADVIHVRRGADRYYPVRGVGVVEEFVSSLDRVAQEEAYESNALSNGAVPSVAVIAPQPTLTQEVADEAKASWLAKQGGPTREPVILPNGSQVVPLAWSPTDAQLSEARRMSLIDVANMFNLDGYWLGAPVAGMTYRSSAPQYQQVLRTSLEPVLADFEAAWSDAWLPRGTVVRFKRSQLLREDLATSMVAAQQGYTSGILSQPEARVMVGLPPDVAGAIGTMADMSATVPEAAPEGGAPTDTGGPSNAPNA